MSEKPLISILTPTYNREKFISKLINSLINQEFRNFEWIIANDGSTDNTENLILEAIPNLINDVIYIKSSKRIGKACMDNLLIHHARGKFITWCDSDDYFIDNIFSEIIMFLSHINSEINNDLAGVIFQNFDQNGISQTYDKSKIPPYKKQVTWDEAQNYLIGDGTIFTRNELIKKLFFKEVDFLISEGSEIEKIFNNKNFLISNKVVKIMDRTAEDSVSFGKKLRFSRGMAYSIAQYMSPKNFKNLNFKIKLINLTNFWRYCIHGELSLIKAISIWKVIQNNKFLIFFILPGLLLAIVDIIKGKVEKTHREFERNKINFKISTVTYFKK